MGLPPWTGLLQTDWVRFFLDLLKWVGLPGLFRFFGNVFGRVLEVGEIEG